MKRIPLTRGYFATVDDGDYEALIQYNWRASINHKKGKWVVYACRRSPMVDRVPGKIVYMHRQILGLTDRQIQTDHIDFDGLNNQRSNLRKCTASQNGFHQRRSGGKTKIRGVSPHPQSPRYRARIHVNGKEYHLGMFDTIEEAAAVHAEAAKRFFGGFAA